MFAHADATGAIVRIQSTATIDPAEPLDVAVIPPGLSPYGVALTHYVAVGPEGPELLLKTDLAELPSSGTAPLTVPLAAFPPGTVVVVTNPEGQAWRLTDMGDPIVFTDPGEYRVEIAPTGPFEAATHLVSVTDA